MSLARTITITAVALCAAAAPTLPAGAAPDRPGSASAALATTSVARPVAADVPAEMLTALQRDLGLTEAQARAKLAGDAAAASVEPALRARLGRSFGGVWVDAAGAVSVATSDPAAAAAIRAAGARPVLVRRSLSTLDATRAALDRRTIPAAVTSWYVDLPSNSVVVEVDRARRTAAVDRFLAALSAGAPAVRVVEVTEAPRLHYNVVGGDAWYTGNIRCSIGFSARTASGARRFLTAGHCTVGRRGNAAYGANRVRIGSVASGTFARAGDYGTVAVTSSAWRLRPWVNLYDGRALVVRGAREAAVGASVCRSGSTTGYRCGRVQDKNVTVNYTNGPRVGGLTRTSADSAAGDSGGPFVAGGGQAQGMLSGGNGTTSYFQPVREALNAYNLRLVTG
jgi:streptogrisin C